MLVVFNLDWKKFDIDSQVSAANRKINGLAARKNAGCFIMFNLASLGGGEWITGIRTPESEKPDDRTIDYLRRRHWRIARDLGNDPGFRAYRDAAEMLSGLKTRGYELAAVFAGAGDVAQEELKRARILDFFEDHVYSRDSVPGANDQVIYRHAMSMQKKESFETIIVSDDPGVISNARFLGPRATVGYLPFGKEDETSAGLKKLQHAKANYAVAGGYSIPVICDFVRGDWTLK